MPILSQSLLHTPYCVISLSSPLVLVAQIFLRLTYSFSKSVHLVYFLPSIVNGKMQSWSGFWLNIERSADVLHVVGFPMTNEKKSISRNFCKKKKKKSEKFQNSYVQCETYLFCLFLDTQRPRQTRPCTWHQDGTRKRPNTFLYANFRCCRGFR